MTSVANDLMTDLSVARAEAIKRGTRTAICTSNNGTGCTATSWNQGWIVFADTATGGGSYGAVVGSDVILKVAPKIYGADEASPSMIRGINELSGPSGGKYVGFRPSGVTTPDGFGTTTTIEFYLCDSRTTDNVGTAAATDKGRHIIVLGTGRASVKRCRCSGTTPTSIACAP